MYHTHRDLYDEGLLSRRTPQKPLKMAYSTRSNSNVACPLIATGEGSALPFTGTPADLCHDSPFVIGHERASKKINLLLLTNPV